MASSTYQANTGPRLSSTTTEPASASNHTAFSSEPDASGPARGTMSGLAVNAPPLDAAPTGR